jgi:hypothetical protein
MKLTQRIALFCFLVCMLLCAVVALISIWSPFAEGFAAGVAGRLFATFFVVGLASFLVWITTIAIDLRSCIHEDKGDDDGKGRAH